MERPVHSRPVSEEDEALKKPRLEASPSSEDIEKFLIFNDSEYKLPLYLSQFVLWVFNSEKKASYERVNVIKTMKSLDAVEGTTYLVTFEASLPNRSNNAKTFQTNISLSSLNGITKIKIKFIRMKPSGFDYDGEEDSEEKVSESKEEASKEEVFESDEEDFKKELYDESDEEDNEELKLSETDEKDNEEKLSEYDEKHNEEKLDVRKTVGEKGPRQCSTVVEKGDVSESKEEGSEEDISDSNEEDSEEELSDESDEEDNKEKLCRRETVRGKAPRVQLYYGSWTYYDPPEVNLSTDDLNQLIYLSQLALCVYNMKEVTYYDNVKVLRTVQSPCAGSSYHITFEASLSDGNAITFQTKIWVCPYLPDHATEIKFVKPRTNSVDIAE